MAHGSKFFTYIVGLCNQRPLVRDVSKYYNLIIQDKVKDVWKEGVKSGCYILVRCKNEEQLKMFGQQYFKVYGNKFDNYYYLLRYLKACYATFIHNKSINW